MTTKIINGVKTIPMNGWRTRTLARYFYGNPEGEEKFYEGQRFIVPAEVLRDLPAFDKENQDYVDSFSGDVVCQVEELEGSYGMHLSIEKAKGPKEIEKDYGAWYDLIKIEICTRYSNPVIKIYFKDIRPEDLLLTIKADDIRQYKLLDLAPYLKQWDMDSSSLIFRVIQTYGDTINTKLEKAHVL